MSAYNMAYNIYQDARYETVLANQGSFMGECAMGVSDLSKDLCRFLLESDQAFPFNSLFRDDLFEKTCAMLRDKNKARIVRDISPLLVPSAEVFALRGANHLKILIESMGEDWTNAVPITRTLPRPGYSVGFKREAFTDEQLNKIGPFLVDITEPSFFVATCNMYFPFFACEAVSGGQALDVADRENAHSMSIAVRGVVELFRLVGREAELHREIVAFSISHDTSSVRIYGHYPLINGDRTAFYRHTIHEFYFTALEGRERWTAYQFTKNLYDLWMPDHHSRICSVINMLPLNFPY